MKAVIIGGTGAVGKELVSQLSQHQDIEEIIVISRRKLNMAEQFPESEKFQINASKIHVAVVDFSDLEKQLKSIIPENSLAFMTLGTTQKIAGSKERFKAIDYGYALSFAKACKDCDVQVLGVLTALGANPKSKSYYSKIKGEIENDISALNINSLYFFQPSLLLGRPKDGRAKEIWAERLLTPILNFIPKAVRPIHTQAVARAMVNTLINAADSTSCSTNKARIITNSAMNN